MSDLSPMIQDVLNGKSPDAVVDEFMVLKDYDDGGLSDRILGLVKDQAVAVVGVHKAVQDGQSVFRLQVIARGKSYAIRVASRSGKFEEGTIGCKDTGYKRGLAESDLAIVVLQTLFGHQCLRGPDVISRISKLPPTQELTTNMLGLDWMRVKDKTVGETVDFILPVRSARLSIQTLNAGTLFRSLCAARNGDERTKVCVRPLPSPEGHRPRYVVLEGQYEAATAILLGRQWMPALLERGKET